VQRAGQRRGVSPDIDSAGDLTARLGDRLAGFQCVEAGDLLQPGFNQISGFEQDGGTLAGLHARPGADLESAVRRLHGCLDIGLAGLRIARHDKAVSGGGSVHHAAIPGIDMLAVDEQLVGLGLRRGLGWHADGERSGHRLPMSVRKPAWSCRETPRRQP